LKRLESWGLKTFSTEDPRLFLRDIHDKVRDNLCDLVIIDYRMPFVSGTILSQRIGSDDQLKDLPVILFTSNTDHLVVDGDILYPRIFKALEKPVKTSLLLKTIREIFENSKKVALPPEQTSTEFPVKVLVANIPQESNQPLKRTVLIVEDNPINQKVCSRLIERLGASFAIANNGE
jgi:CheY-like chemotaxis protein